MRIPYRFYFFFPRWYRTFSRTKFKTKEFETNATTCYSSQTLILNFMLQNTTQAKNVNFNLCYKMPHKPNVILKLMLQKPKLFLNANMLLKC